MRRSTFFRFILLGFIASFALGVLFFYELRSLNEASTAEARRHIALFTAQIIESAPYTESVNNERFHSRRHWGGANLWVLNSEGQILASSTKDALPVAWGDLRKPTAIHDLTFHYRTFQLVSDLTLVRLDSTQEAYLLIASRRSANSAAGSWFVQFAFFLFFFGVSVLIAFALLSIYLRKKSAEARQVLAKLESGDLKARFEIDRIDEIGSLMQDFNRMAAEIERLVDRIRQTELARKDLLEELSHDIRTPLTSLRTSIETLHDHLDEMPKSEQKEMLDICNTELKYFIQLIDDLFFIANLGEPRYKQTVQDVDLKALISEELRAKHQLLSIRWVWKPEDTSENAGVVRGDPLLLQRLLKNALTNAARHAMDEIRVELEFNGRESMVHISDNGPGMSEEAIEHFGERKIHRVAYKNGDYDISLGLGSVIMKKIIELHGGSITLQNLSPGLRITLRLPSK